MYITMVLFIQYSVTCLCKFGLKKKINLFMRQSVLETAQCFCEWQQTELKGQILEGSGPGLARRVGAVAAGWQAVCWPTGSFLFVSVEAASAGCSQGESDRRSSEFSSRLHLGNHGYRSFRGQMTDVSKVGDGLTHAHWRTASFEAAVSSGCHGQPPSTLARGPLHPPPSRVAPSSRLVGYF